MIVTVTLNPAVDRTIYVDDFNKGEVNKAISSIVDPGGKGINVSKVVKSLGQNTLALGFLGGDTGDFIKRALIKQGITEGFTIVEKTTRTNIKIVSSTTEETTDINEPGEEISKDELLKFTINFKKSIKKGDIVVLSGSVPKGIPVDIHKELADMANKAGCKVILDVSGPYLKEGIKAKPYMIKPNIHELEELIGKNLDDQKDVIGVCRNIIDSGVTLVCVSMGSRGALLIGKDFIMHSASTRVAVKSTVGAGDSLVGGMASGMNQGQTIENAFKLGIAASTSAVMQVGTKAPSMEEIRNIYDKIIVTIEKEL